MVGSSNGMTDHFADNIACCVLNTFESLPQKFKPRHRDSDVKEWTPLCGIVLSRESSLTCVALGTGSKCLPASLVPEASGHILHDWHAEIIAIRAFNHFLISQSKLASAEGDDSAKFVRRRDIHELTVSSPQPFAIKDDVNIHMYCSEAPCGDASMELIAAAQEDDTPWERPSVYDEVDSSFTEPKLLGRKYFTEKGVVRRKPARSDAPESLSKSCSDKIALKQCTSLLNSVSTILISPQNAYLQKLVLPQSQYVPEACERAFTSLGRFSVLKSSMMDSWEGNFTYHPLRIQVTSREYPWSRRNRGNVRKFVASNTSAVYTKYNQEVLVNGVLQGRKQKDPRGAGLLCRRNLWRSIIEALISSGLSDAAVTLSQVSYEELKDDARLACRTKVKLDVQSNVLRGWINNYKEIDFKLGVTFQIDCKGL